jgi:hypothetical protein
MLQPLNWRTSMAIRMVSKVGVCFHLSFFCSHPGGCRGNMEQVVCQLQHPGASGAALDMLHQAMQYRHGYQNDQQRRYICSSMPPLLFEKS